MKDNEIAKSFRVEGNLFFKQDKFFQALENYNKCLMFAETPSIEKSLAFANRSAVYMKVKEYQLCLENIKLAKDSGYPAEKMQMLILRAAKCNKLIESVKDKEDSESFFKLSYPANENIPFIVQCLELRRNERFGRHIVATQGKLPFLLKLS
jgi:SET and MYND domain-containing protein 4